MTHRIALRLAAMTGGAALVGIVLLAQAPKAHACGCFAPPDPSVPIVQAGELIAFHMEEGKVTAHIQIAYNGPAEEFGWLLPLPSLPTMDVGTDELFVQLIQQTQPLYRLDLEYNGDCPFDPNRGGGLGFGDSASPNEDAGDDGDGGGDGYNPLVIRDTVGPYDYAVLRADEKQPMLDWLDANGFFVPAGTDSAVDAYIRPGAYFLALKLLKGNDVGDIQPVVVEYESDLPMIPIVLTSVAADPDMPILVWVLGEHRAIPRNYHHTKINDAELDWLNAAQNYVEVITRAVDEADGHHSFVTEYAGTSSVMTDILDYPGRFGDVGELGAIIDAVQFVQYLTSTGYTSGGNTAPFFQPVFTSQVLGILQKHLPVPAALLAELEAQGGGANSYYLSMSYYVGVDRYERPELYEDLDLEFDSVAMAAELDERVVKPTLAAGEMFHKNSFMTRMFTTLSPDEMTKDPVFSFNPDLEEVSNVHSGRLIYYCGIIEEDTLTTTPAKLVTESGWELPLPNGTGENPWVDVPWPMSHQIHVVREEGPKQVIVDNTDLILATIRTHRGDDGGCGVAGGSSSLSALLLGAFGGFVLLRRRRRR